MAQINKPNLHFKPVAFTGNTSAGHAITGVGFQPDWVWLKTVNSSNNHTIFDVVRGVTKRIRSNQTNAENTSSGVTSFDTDGFTVGADSAGNDGSMISWNWKTQNSQGSSNTDGTINSTYTSVNTTAGFSIVQYTGTGSNATVGHGLGVAPSSVLIKKTSGTSQWIFGHTGIGFTKFLELNLTPLFI